MANGEWIIVDFVDIVVHIFHREKRDFYQLDDLWHDASSVRYGDDSEPIEAKKATKKAAKKVLSDEEFDDVDAPPKRVYVKKATTAKKSIKAPAKKAPATKAPIKKATPSKAAAKKAPAKKAVAKKAVAKKDVKKKS
jgi:hypothetical protein